MKIFNIIISSLSWYLHWNLGLIWNQYLKSKFLYVCIHSEKFRTEWYISMLSEINALKTYYYSVCACTSYMCPHMCVWWMFMVHMCVIQKKFGDSILSFKFSWFPNTKFRDGTYRKWLNREVTGLKNRLTLCWMDIWMECEEMVGIGKGKS